MCPLKFVKSGECTQFGAADVTSLGRSILDGTVQGVHAASAGGLLCAARAAADSGVSIFLEGYCPTFLVMISSEQKHRPGSLARVMLDWAG